MFPAPWYCDGCGRQNGNTRFQCQQCRGFNTYDLCDQCILRASVIHPNHSFQLVQQTGYSVPMSNWMWSSYGPTSTMAYQQPNYFSYTGQGRPTVKVTYEYQT
jgi:hypothetical protein